MDGVHDDEYCDDDSYVDDRNDDDDDDDDDDDKPGLMVQAIIGIRNQGRAGHGQTPDWDDHNDVDNPNC